MKKISLRLLILILFFGANISTHVANAQIPVTDAASIGARAFEALESLNQAVLQYEAVTGQFKKIYGEVKLPVEMGRSIYESGCILNEISNEVSVLQRDLENAKYLTPKEKIQMMRAYRNAIKQGTKMIEELNFLKGFDKSIPPLERKAAFDQTRDDLMLVRDYVRTLSWRWRGINKMRLNKASDDFRMELLSRPIKKK